ncbi:hypothetical protein JCM12856_23670 [Spirochaeta dissipatitropha]
MLSALAIGKLEQDITLKAARQKARMQTRPGAGLTSRSDFIFFSIEFRTTGVSLNEMGLLFNTT